MLYRSINLHSALELVNSDFSSYLSNLEDYENVLAVNSTVGAAGPNGAVNSGRIIIRLKPLSQRRLSSDQIIQKLRPKVSKIPGLRVLMESPPAIAIGGQQTTQYFNTHYKV